MPWCLDTVHITTSSVHLFLQNETNLQLVKSTLWCAIDQNVHKNISEIITISWTLYFKTLIYTLWQHHYVLVFHTCFNYPVYHSFYRNNCTAWFLWVLSPRHCALVGWDFSVLKVVLSLLPYMSSHNSLLP